MLACWLYSSTQMRKSVISDISTLCAKFDKEPWFGDNSVCWGHSLSPQTRDGATRCPREVSHRLLSSFRVSRASHGGSATLPSQMASVLVHLGSPEGWEGDTREEEWGLRLPGEPWPPQHAPSHHEERPTWGIVLGKGPEHAGEPPEPLVTTRPFSISLTCLTNIYTWHSWKIQSLPALPVI